LPPIKFRREDAEKTMLVHSFQTFLTKLSKLLCRPRYHPERHYMRGPGPKCRAAGHADEV
jgi:hypothetical protein